MSIGRIVVSFVIALATCLLIWAVAFVVSRMLDGSAANVVGGFVFGTFALVWGLVYFNLEVEVRHSGVQASVADDLAAFERSDEPEAPYLWPGDRVGEQVIGGENETLRFDPDDVPPTPRRGLAPNS